MFITKFKKNFSKRLKTTQNLNKSNQSSRFDYK